MILLYYRDHKLSLQVECESRRGQIYSV